MEGFTPGLCAYSMPISSRSTFRLALRLLFGPLPLLGIRVQFVHGFDHVALVNDVVSLEDGARLVAADEHGHLVHGEFL